MKTSTAGRAAISAREGCILTAYKDSAGVLTIGVGHTTAAGPPAVTAGLKITAAQADEILSRDLAAVEADVNRLVTVPLNQNEFDALVSLVFNIGGTAFRKSTLRAKLNAGDRAGAANAFLSWNKITKGGKKVALEGLTNRRKAERAQFLAPTTAAKPADAPKPVAAPQSPPREPAPQASPSPLPVNGGAVGILLGGIAAILAGAWASLAGLPCEYLNLFCGG
ncbi:MAG: glycoside hydrolase family protein [Rhizobiales bacterium]|nr:glycoside hydrolase family protein [Hyphomicrobiales bacterium]